MKRGFFHPSELISKEKLSTVPKCGSCQLFKGCKSPKMEVDGEGRRKIFILGEAPGKDEDEQGIPFVGKTGQLLQRFLKGHGVDMRRDCWIYNSLICRPPKNEIVDEDRKIEYCRPNVINTINRLKPEIILTFGKIPIKSLIGHIWKDDVGTMTRWAGWRIPSQQLNAWVCPLWHPSYLAREHNPVLDLWFNKYLEQALQLEGRPWKEVPNYEEKVSICLDPEVAAQNIYRMCSDGGVAAFDYETNCLKPDNDQARIICCSICYKDEDTIAFPWIEPAISQMKDFLRSPNVAKIGSNIKFEDRWTRRVFGFGVNNWVWDTMVAAHVLDCRKDDQKKGITSIKFQSFVRLGMGSYNDAIEPFLKGRGSNDLNNIKQVELKQLLLYCGLDSLLEYKVAKLQMEEMQSDHLEI